MQFYFSKTKPSDKNTHFISLENSSDTWLEAPVGKGKILHFGLGEKTKYDRRKLIRLVRRIIGLAKTHKLKNIALGFEQFTELVQDVTPEQVARLLAVNIEMANYEYSVYKTAKKNFIGIENVTLVGNLAAEVKKEITAGQIIGQEVNNTRSLANTPGGEMTPALLAAAAKQSARGLPVRVKVLNVPEMKKLKMGGVLGVAQGSAEKPAFIIMEYFGGKKSERPVVLVGKGITFDTGGLNLKPSEGIYEMHMDMSGGAAVIHTVTLAARLKLKKNIIGLVPAAENMTSGTSFRPGDILRSMSGKTIEVLNTDAEGRIILADGLTYAQRYNPRLIVDVATLTGAAMVAVGQKCSAIFTKDEELEKLFRDLGEQSGDYVWPLPLWEEYEDDIKGSFGDWANLGKSKYGGATQAAIFLYQFAKGYPWVHIDIAPRMTAVEGDHLAKGAAGAPVRLLIELLESF